MKKISYKIIVETVGSESEQLEAYKKVIELIISNHICEVDHGKGSDISESIH